MTAGLDQGSYQILKLVTIPLFLLGLPILAIVTLRARILLRWPAILLLISPIFLTAGGALPFLPSAGRFSPAMVYLALAGFGYALLVDKGAPTAYAEANPTRVAETPVEAIP